MINIVLRLRPETKLLRLTPKEADRGKKNTEEELKTTRLKVIILINPDRKAKIRIPELSSSLLSFKAFLQNQVFLNYEARFKE